MCMWVCVRVCVDALRALVMGVCGSHAWKRPSGCAEYARTQGGQRVAGSPHWVASLHGVFGMQQGEGTLVPGPALGAYERMQHALWVARCCKQRMAGMRLEPGARTHCHGGELAGCWPSSAWQAVTFAMQACPVCFDAGPAWCQQARAALELHVLQVGTWLLCLQCSCGTSRHPCEPPVRLAPSAIAAWLLAISSPC